MADEERKQLVVPLALPSWEELNRRVNVWTTNALDTFVSRFTFAGWKAQEPTYDLVPDGDDQWVGNEDNHPRGVAVGLPSGDPATPGIQGVMVERTGAADGNGGVALVGFKDQPTRIDDPGTLANAPVEVSGSVILLMGGGLRIEVSEPIDKEHYLILGTSTTLADGRHVVPLLIGPQYIPTDSNAATDTNDYDLDDVGGDQIVVTLNVTGTFLPNVSSFRYEVRLSEEGGRQTLFTVSIWLDQGGGYVQVFADEYSLSGSAQNVVRSTPVDTVTIGPGDAIQMRVNSVGTNPQSDGWVRGSVTPSLLELRTG